MELPSALSRMLASACENDQLKNWSVYEERDGVYTFKIRFVPIKVSHNGSDISEIQPPVAKNVHNCAFKQKSDKQFARDRNRFSDWKDKRVTRSMAKQATVDEQVADSATQVASRINPKSPIESFRSLAPCNFDTPDTPKKDTILDETVREEYEISQVFVHSASDDECEAIDNHFRCPGNCPPTCCYSPIGSDGNHNVYKCIKCSSMPGGTFWICQPCMEGGAHAPHHKYLRLDIPKK